MDIKVCCHNCKETSTYSVNLTTHIEVVRVVEEISPIRIVKRTNATPAPQYILDIIEQRRIDAINAKVDNDILREAGFKSDPRKVADDIMNNPTAWLTRPE